MAVCSIRAQSHETQHELSMTIDQHDSVSEKKATDLLETQLQNVSAAGLYLH